MISKCDYNYIRRGLNQRNFLNLFILSVTIGRKVCMKRKWEAKKNFYVKSWMKWIVWKWNITRGFKMKSTSTVSFCFKFSKYTGVSQAILYFKLLVHKAELMEGVSINGALWWTQFYLQCWLVRIRFLQGWSPVVTHRDSTLNYLQCTSACVWLLFNNFKQGFTFHYRRSSWP